MATLRILIVADDDSGFQRSTNASHKSHLGEFVKVLQETDWQGFDIELVKAHRGANTGPSKGADIYNFRFTNTSLADFDMAFYFSFDTIFDSGLTTDVERRQEAAAIATFMEAGKGYFAAGDHEDIGAAINQHVPRVRSMRRWAFSAASPYGIGIAPSAMGADRHDTLQAGSDSGSNGGTTFPYQFNDQSDDTPQPIRVNYYPLWSSRFFHSSMPHPLLCSPMGRIDVLPDHMHEGWCEVPSDLSQEENLPGRASKKEYPLDQHGNPFPPEVIADGTVLAHSTLNQEFGTSISPMTSHKPFGVIGAYDGHQVGIGRCVVDSTWHHFVNINLIGTESTFAGINTNKTKGFYTGPGDTPTPAYQKIMHYYRNLVYWLIPANRGNLIIKQLATAIYRHPHAEVFRGGLYQRENFQRFRLWEIIGFAQLAEDYFKQVRGSCAVLQLLPIILYPIWRFDPRIWEELLPEINPWDIAVTKLTEKFQPFDPRHIDFVPGTKLRRQVILGTLAWAVKFTVNADEELTEKHVDNIQSTFQQLIPYGLQIAAKTLAEGLQASAVIHKGLVELSEQLSKYSSAQSPATSACAPEPAK
ncbi:MAG TPA: hypothetical protein VLC79_02105 [Cellvibrio sp.]|nr:hypothetical protein [Cellvibrio sp.]